MDFPTLIEVKAIEKYKLFLRYDDGTAGILDVSESAGKGVFAYWDIGDNFFKVHINPILNGITWSEDLDICPDGAYLELKGMNYSEWKEKNAPHATA